MTNTTAGTKFSFNLTTGRNGHPTPKSQREQRAAVLTFLGWAPEGSCVEDRYCASTAELIEIANGIVR